MEIIIIARILELVKQDAWLGEATVDYKTRIIDRTDMKVKRAMKSARAPTFARPGSHGWGGHQWALGAWRTVGCLKIPVMQTRQERGTEIDRRAGAGRHTRMIRTDLGHALPEKFGQNELLAG